MTDDIKHCYYFGCKDEAGHYLFNEQGMPRGRGDRKELPFPRETLDGGLLPHNKDKIEGRAVLVNFSSGWTVITFWDNSVDPRGGSCSAFVIPHDVTFDEAVEIAKERFPWVWNRFKFEVVLDK